MISMPHKRSRSSGFTLIELLTVTSLVAVLLGIGIPSFKYVTSANRASGEINGLLSDMQFARAEAIKQGQTVTICASTTGTTCSASTTWNTGWIVFNDQGVTGTVNPATDSILKVQKVFSNTDSLLADQTTKFVAFSREGFALSLANPVTFTLTTSPVNPRYTRCLSLTIVGAISTQIGGATTAENTAC